MAASSTKMGRNDLFTQANSGALFSHLTSLTTVEISKTVEVIGKSFFKQCSTLTNVILHKDAGLKTIDSESFAGCKALININLGDAGPIIEIPEKCFFSCTSLRTVSIPGTATIIRKQAFYGCISLVDVEFQEGVKTIGESSFAKCSGLTTIPLPSSLKVISSKAFENCTSLLGVEIPQDRDLKKIHAKAFAGCWALANISLPYSAIFTHNTFQNCNLFASEGEWDPTECLRMRYDGSPVHNICYDSSSQTSDTVNQLLQVWEELSLSNTKWLEDRLRYDDDLGMNPFHIVVTSVNLKKEILEFLLNRYPKKVLVSGEFNAKTMMDYLLIHSSKEAVPLIQMTLQKVFVTSINDWGMGLIPKWKADLEQHIQSLHVPTAGDHDIQTRRKLVREDTTRE
ncbi:unnamed protein product [Cylindrotheca closterium]|uniref:Leucine-rich repeat domain-containing protein n=1 Tax=Cylindrotheca closterium TaxID=2856 RepID=A0AAD2CPK5_9STRA|nr:unnamed protein product [Cylindrotheca closterium]